MKYENNKLTIIFESSRLMSDIAAMFTSARIDNYKSCIDNALIKLTRFFEFDRAYIFRYDFENNCCSNIFEFCRNNLYEIRKLKDLKLNKIDALFVTHKNKKIYCIPNVNMLHSSDNMRKAMESQNTQSLITIPLIKNDELYGFLGFDSMYTTRDYSDYEKLLLTEYGSLFANLLKRIDLELDIKEQNIKTENILETAEIGTWEWNIKTNIIKVHKNCTRFLMYDYGEMSCISFDKWESLTHPDDLEKASGEIAKLLKGEIDSFQSEYRMIHKDGNFIWIKAVGKVIEWEDGKPLTVLGSHIDITQMKNQKHNTEILIKALEHTPTSIVIADSHGDIEYVNPYFTLKTGFNFDEVVGKNVSTLQSNENDNVLFNAMWKHLKSGKIWKGEILSRKKNNEPFWESVLIAPVPDDNNIITHYVSVKNDITEIKENLIYLFEQKDELEAIIRSKIDDVETAQKSVIMTLAKLTESRDYGTGRHVERVQSLCRLLSKSLITVPKCRKTVNNNFIDDIYYASALHDIGKITIPDSILLKPGTLTSEEFEIIKNHIASGYDILSEMARQNPQNKIVMSARIAKYHHERWDGKGYGSGLKGEEIPLEARIVALVDVYDALRSKRPYKQAYSHQEAYEIILGQSGQQFDPTLVSVFDKINDKFELVYDSFE